MLKACVDCGESINRRSVRCRKCHGAHVKVVREPQWRASLERYYKSRPLRRYTCEWCGEERETYSEKRQFCSGRCSWTSWRFRQWQAERQAKEAR